MKKAPRKPKIPAEKVQEATINPNAKILTVDTEGEGIDGIYTDNEINDIINNCCNITLINRIQTLEARLLAAGIA